MGFIEDNQKRMKEMERKEKRFKIIFWILIFISGIGFYYLILK